MVGLWQCSPEMAVKKGGPREGHGGDRKKDPEKHGWEIKTKAAGQPILVGKSKLINHFSN